MTDCVCFSQFSSPDCKGFTSLETSHIKEQSTTLETLKGKQKTQTKKKRLCKIEEHFQYLLKSLEHSALTSSGSEKQRILKINKHAIILSLPSVASVGIVSLWWDSDWRLLIITTAYI